MKNKILKLLAVISCIFIFIIYFSAESLLMSGVQFNKQIHKDLIIINYNQPLSIIRELDKTLEYNYDFQNKLDFFSFVENIPVLNKSYVDAKKLTDISIFTINGLKITKEIEILKNKPSYQADQEIKTLNSTKKQYFIKAIYLINQIAQDSDYNLLIKPFRQQILKAKKEIEKWSNY